MLEPVSPGDDRAARIQDSVIEVPNHVQLAACVPVRPGGPVGEQKGPNTYAEPARTALNDSQRTNPDLRKSHFRRSAIVPSVVHTYGLFQVCSTHLIGIKPQVNSRE